MKEVGLGKTFEMPAVKYFRDIPISHKDSHFICLEIKDRVATFRASSQEMVSFTRQHVSAQKVQIRLQQQGLSVHRPWFGCSTFYITLDSVFNVVFVKFLDSGMASRHVLCTDS